MHWLYPTNAKSDYYLEVSGDGAFRWARPNLGKPDLGHHQTRRPTRGLYYDTYTMIDICSRYIIGWKVAATESAELAAFISDIIATHEIRRSSTPTAAPS